MTDQRAQGGWIGPEDGVEILGALPAQRVRLRFSGIWAGREVVWDAVFVTLRALAAAGEPAGRRFIEIDPGRAEAGTPRLRVGLDLPVIDLPAVRKAVIMVRNYRRLRPGRMEFGPPARPEPG